MHTFAVIESNNVHYRRISNHVNVNIPENKQKYIPFIGNKLTSTFGFSMRAACGVADTGTQLLVQRL